MIDFELIIHNVSVIIAAIAAIIAAIKAGQAHTNSKLNTDLIAANGDIAAAAAVAAATSIKILTDNDKKKGGKAK